MCFFGTLELDYPRNIGLRRAFEAAHWDVVLCNDLPLKKDRQLDAAISPLRLLPNALTLSGSYLRLFNKARQSGPFDILFTGFPGYLDLPAAWLCSRLIGAKLVWDPFLPLPELIAERGFADPWSKQFRLCRKFERFFFRRADLVLTQTEALKRHLMRTYGTGAEKFESIPLGVDEAIFQPAPASPNQHPEVLYVGCFLPNHGLDTVLDGVKLLNSDCPFRLTLIGDGPERSRIAQRIESEGISSITLHPPIAAADVPARIARADILLGVFGETFQSEMTLHNKVLQGLTVGRPVLTRNSQALREVAVSETEIATCEAGDPSAFAASLHKLLSDSEYRRTLGELALEAHKRTFSQTAINERLKEILSNLSFSRIV